MANDALPVLRLTIPKFVTTLQTLLIRGNTREFVLAALSGEFRGRQITVDALDNRIYDVGDSDDQDDPTLYGYRAVFDVDSLLGLSDNICVENQYLIFYVLPRFGDALSKDVGIERGIDIGGTNYSVKLNVIPNMIFARWGVRNEILIFFPGLYSPGQRESHKVDNGETALFFEHALRIALNRQMPGLRGTNLPPNLSAELWRARNPNGSFQFGGRVLSKEVASALGDELRRCIEEACERGVDMDWARGFFFLHQVRGVKDSNAHSLDDGSQAALQFVEQNHLSLDALQSDPDSWFVDYGVELSSMNGGDWLAWRADSHTALLEVLGIPHLHAVRMTKIGSSSYTRDPTSHLTEVAGCRVVLGQRGRGPLSVVKIQAYQTDKSLTATKGEGAGKNAKSLSLKPYMNRSGNQNQNFFPDLYDVCEDAISAGVVSNARFEARIPIGKLEDLTIALSDVNWRKHVVAITCADWWKLRSLPLIAYKSVIDTHFSSRPADRMSASKIALAMAVVWLTNCLYAAPDTGPSSRALLRGVLPLRPRLNMDQHIMPFRTARPRTNDEEEGGDGYDEEEDLAPCHPYGIFFLRKINYSNACPIPEVGGMSAESKADLHEGVFEYFFGLSYDDYSRGLYNDLLFAKTNPNRTRNKAKLRPHVPEPGQEIPIVFQLPGGHKLIRKPAWLGDRIVHEEEEDSEFTTRNQYISAVYHQLMLDVMTKSPNKGGNKNAYAKIDKAHFAMVDDTIFRSNNPAATFTKAHMKVGDRDDWELSFKHLFPPMGELKVTSAQNYPSCPYYQMWGHFHQEVHNIGEIEKVRKEIKKKFFREVRWFAWAKSERMWESSSKTYTNFRNSPGLEQTEPAPWLLVRRGVIWDPRECWTPDGIVPGDDEGRVHRDDGERLHRDDEERLHHDDEERLHRDEQRDARFAHAEDQDGEGSEHEEDLDMEEIEEDLFM